MLKSKHIDKISIGAIIVALLLTFLFMKGEQLGLQKVSASPPYAEKLFDQTKVHTIDILLPQDDWQYLLDNALKEEYMNCDLLIDDELFRNMALRVKGNNSKNLTAKYGSDRFSLKIEFDHYSDGRTYYGLDKLSLSASFQDNAFLKDYMTYDMMSHMGVPAPLCSFAYLTVNGKDWGLFVAIEDIEDAFAKRNFGADHGRIYKPDYKNLDDENSDIALRYTNDAFESYDNIFNSAKFDVSTADKKRLIRALKRLSDGEELEKAVDIDSVIRYFVVQSFVVNLDSYLGPTGHNYYLYEKNGILTMLPWDYNLAYATYPLGMPNPIDDSTYFVNYPIDTPAPGYVMVERPMFHNLMLHDEYFSLYHTKYQEFIQTYFDSGHFQKKISETVKRIAPFVEKDPTKFCSYQQFLRAVDTFEQFCLLRAESITGQLNGSIPSTFKGQEEDTENRIDASSISIPDLGSLDDMKSLNKS